MKKNEDCILEKINDQGVFFAGGEALPWEEIEVVGLRESGTPKLLNPFLYTNLNFFSPRVVFLNEFYIKDKNGRLLFPTNLSCRRKDYLSNEAILALAFELLTSVIKHEHVKFEFSSELERQESDISKEIERIRFALSAEGKIQASKLKASDQQKQGQFYMVFILLVIIFSILVGHFVKQGLQ